MQRPDEGGPAGPAEPGTPACGGTPPHAGGPEAQAALHPRYGAPDPHTAASPRAADRGAYPGLVSRLLALGVDALVVGSAVALVGAGGPALWHTLTGSTPDWLLACASVAAGLVPVGYFWLGWWVLGRSLGGLLLGFVVLGADGQRMRPLHAGLRSFLGLVFAPFWLVGMLLILITSRRRALHDIVLGTVVVHSAHDPLEPHPSHAAGAAARRIGEAPP